VAKNKLQIWGKAQPESARRPKSDCKKNLGGEIPKVAKSRGRNSNALALLVGVVVTRFV